MGHMIFGNLGALSFWGVLAVLIYVAVRATINRVGSDSKSNDPVDILRRRYARGEIDKEEFDRRMKDLT
ncbi:MAG: electron transporter RnfE [Ponticaulis sp.]|nr:electron transporter RnfE [Ponticaulis sp.]MAF58432.1 electron transporter RnfE [Ponticaulis sp.]|tara:strand:+ start:701 stop:907 length:207 start_codon:yes stop_codon:yes gene_type:complete